MGKIFAHRGFSSIYSENSLEAIKECFKYDYIDGIEIDIRMTKDEKFVLIHNSSIDLVSNGNGFVNDYTLDELLEFDFHTNSIDYKINYLKSYINKNGFHIRKMLRKIRKHKFKIVTLEEVLDVLNDKILLIEIKYMNGDKFNLEKFLNIINKYKNKNIMIQSFNKNIINRLKKLDKNLNLGILMEIASEEKLSMKTNFISISNEAVNNDILVKALYNKKSVNVWTIDYYRQFKKLVNVLDGKINDVGIITNYPDLIKKYLDKVNKNN